MQLVWGKDDCQFTRQPKDIEHKKAKRQVQVYSAYTSIQEESNTHASMHRKTKLKCLLRLYRILVYVA